MLGKKSSEKSAKNVFLYSHEYRDQKMRGKNARNNFSRNTIIVRAKILGKKSFQKSEKTGFLYSHEYRDQEMGGKKRVKQFFQKHTNSASKRVRKKIVSENCENTFFIFTRIS